MCDMAIAKAASKGINQLASSITNHFSILCTASLQLRHATSAATFVQCFFFLFLFIMIVSFDYRVVLKNTAVWL